MKNCITKFLISFCFVYITTLVIDCSTYSLNYQSLLNTSSDVKYMFEKQGYIDDYYFLKLKKDKIDLITDKKLYSKDEIVTYTLIKNNTHINDYLFKEEIVMSSTCVVGIFNS